MAQVSTRLLLWSLAKESVYFHTFVQNDRKISRQSLHLLLFCINHFVSQGHWLLLHRITSAYFSLSQGFKCATALLFTIAAPLQNCLTPLLFKLLYPCTSWVMGIHTHYTLFLSTSFCFLQKLVLVLPSVFPVGPFGQSKLLLFTLFI